MKKKPEHSYLSTQLALFSPLPFYFQKLQDENNNLDEKTGGENQNDESKDLSTRNVHDTEHQDDQVEGRTLGVVAGNFCCHLLNVFFKFITPIF